MNELQEYHDTFPWTAEVQTLETPIVVVADSVDLHDDSEQSVSDVDTSVVPAAEDRTGRPEEVLTAADSIKKPPVDLPPGGNTTFEDPEENNNLEVIQYADGSTTILNKAHNQPDLLEKVAARLESAEPWSPFPSHIDPESDPEHQKKYYVDDAEDRVFFAKVIPHELEPGGKNEIELASHVHAVVASEQAQRIAQEHGFSSVSYVEPLAIIDKPGENQTIVYPYQDGGRIELSESPARLSELHDVEHKLGGLLAANEVNAYDIDHYQFLAEGDDLYLLDAEHYKRFEPKQPTLASGETLQFVYQRWEDAAGSTEIYSGESAVARQGEDGLGVQLSTDLHEGYAVALWNTHTSEAALLHVQASREARDQIRELTERVPSLVSLSTIAHIIGPADVSINTDRFPPDMNIGTAVYLCSQASQISLFDPEGSSRVSIDSSSGRVEVTTETGEVKRFNPPKKIS